jgi:chromosome segregation ATPase
VKEAEAQLTEEADSLASELEEKGAKLIAAEAERAKLEEYVRAEVSGAMTMTSTLRTELERRLEELTATRKERDESVGDKKKFEEAVEEMKKMMERQEVTFKRTLDTDRNKISGEIKAKMQKLRGLEIEKQELLQETTQLMKQVETTQKQLTTAQTQMQDAVKEAKEAHARIGELEDVKVTLDKEKRVAEQTSDELREHANRLEGSFKEDITRLDNLVKESKKAAAQQVLDISDRVKSANEETDQ